MRRHELDENIVIYFFLNISAFYFIFIMIIYYYITFFTSLFSGVRIIRVVRYHVFISFRTVMPATIYT